MEKQENKFITFLKNPSWDIYLFALLIILVNLVAARAFFRIDLTQSKSYTLSKASRDLIKSIEEPLSVKVFFSSNLPAEENSAKDYVTDLLEEYQNAGGKNFSVEYFNMDKKENQDMALDYGLSQFQVQEVKSDEVGFKAVFMGLVFTYADQIECIDPIASQEEFSNQNYRFEYKITSTISSIISKASLLDGVKDDITLTLYKSDILEKAGIQGFEELDSIVEAALKNINKKNRNRIAYKSLNPSSSEAEELLQKYGLQVLTLRESGRSPVSATLGLVLQAGDSYSTVPLQIYSQNILGYTLNTISGLDTLEENIESSLQSLVKKSAKIAYVTGHGELNTKDSREGCTNFASLLSSTYSLDDIDLSKENISAGTGSLIINGPSSSFSQEELYKIDQYLVRGGNVILFLDPFNVIQPQGQQAQYEMPQYIPNKTGLETLLSKYGIEEKNNYVFDEQCISQMTQQYGKVNFHYVPLMQKENLANHPISKNLGYIYFRQAGELSSQEAEQNRNLKVTRLASSSAKSWTASENFIIHPLYISAPEDKSIEQSYPLSLLVEGTFTSAYDSDPTSTTSEGLSANSHIKNGNQTGRLLIISTSCVTQDIGENADQQPIGLFLQNLVDYMNGRSDLCTMRTKGLNVNVLEKTSSSLRNLIKYFNEIGLAVIVALFGLFAYVSRRNHRNKIRMEYNGEKK